MSNCSCTSLATMAAITALLAGLATNPALAQTRMISQVSSPETTMKQMCGSREVVSKKRGKQTTYSCKSTPKRASAASSANASTSLKAAGGDGGLRAEINCNYSESGGTITWLGCTCSANDDGNCTQFITNCAEQGDEVGGNSGSASCSPGG